MEDLNLNVILIAIFSFIYLLAGFIYALYIVMEKAANIFSIPVNTLFGPLFFPFQVISAYRLLKMKGRRPDPQ